MGTALAAQLNAFTAAACGKRPASSVTASARFAKQLVPKYAHKFHRSGLPRGSLAMGVGKVSRRSVQASASAGAGAPPTEAQMTELRALLYDPATRDESYEGNWAQYLVDLHDCRGTFDFCGGMMFQLVLSDKLRARLAAVAAGEGEQPVVFDASHGRMSATAGYSRAAHADNVRIFHGREVRDVRGAAGGMGMVLHLADSDQDPQGWSPQEVADYDGWGHDSGRPWRNTEVWAREGVKGFEEAFGAPAYGLHHRFYLHLDHRNNLWLSAEDGCEGFARDATAKKGIRQFFSQF